MRLFLEAEEVSPVKSWGVALPALWLTLEEGSLSAPDVGFLRRLFPERRCYVWSISDGGAASPAIRKLRRAFGDWPRLRKSVVVREEMLCGGEPFYCDVALVEPTCDESVAELAGSTLWGKHSGLFVSGDPVEGFPDGLLSLCRVGIEHLGQDRRSEREELLREHLVSCASVGIIPLLVVEDSDARQYLIAPCKDQLPHDAVMPAATSSEFHLWLSKGLDLRILT